MVAINMQGSVRLRDINEDIVSMAVYWQDDPTNVINDMLNSWDVWVGRLDAVTDAVIESTEVRIINGPPIGAKTVAGPQPIASGELATYVLVDDPTRSFGVYTPALNRAFIDLNGKVLVTGANATYLGSWLSTFGPVDLIQLASNLWLPLTRLRLIGLRSRKHRRQQDRVNTVVEP